MDTPFHFDLQQINTMKVSGLAAYVQRPPHNRIGWVLAEGVWLPEWRPRKWAWQVQWIEVTWDSYETVQDTQEAQQDFEPWDYYMVTAHKIFLTEDISVVEAFFAQHTDLPDYAQHPDRVLCPHEFRRYKQTGDLPAHFNLKRREVVRRLLDYQRTGSVITWDDGHERVTGLVQHVALTHARLIDADGVVTTVWLGPSDSLRITVTESDGYVRTDWMSSRRPQGFDPGSLPVWNFKREAWVPLV